MPVPILCLDEHLRQFAQRFRQELSKPQYQYFVIVLLGLTRMSKEREHSRDCCDRLADGPSLAGLSRDLAEAPWQTAAVVDCWLGHFREEMQPQVAAEVQRQRQAQPKRRGRRHPTRCDRVYDPR